MLKASNWPNEIPIQKANQIIGNPLFKNKNGTIAADFIPTNIELIKNRIVEINNLSGDSLG